MKSLNYLKRLSDESLKKRLLKLWKEKAIILTVDEDNNYDYSISKINLIRGRDIFVTFYDKDTFKFDEETTIKQIEKTLIDGLKIFRLDNIEEAKEYILLKQI